MSNRGSEAAGLAAFERYLAFERLEITLGGAAYSCCSAYIKPDFNFGNVFEMDIESTWNSENAKKLRYSVVKGDFEYRRKTCLVWRSRDTDPYPIVKKPNSDYESYHQCVSKGPSIINLACDPSRNLYCSSCRLTYGHSGRESVLSTHCQAV